MNNTISDSVVEKIRKCLALATSNNEHEAQLAMTKAQKIAAEHNVDIALIQIFDKTIKQAPIEKKEGISLGNRKSITQHFVSWILQDHFGVKVIYSGSRAMGRQLILIGTKDNIAMAEYVQVFLNEKFMSLWRDYFKKTNCPLNHRNSYLMGLHRGLDAKLQTSNKEVITDKLIAQSEDTRNQFALMVVNEKERLQEAVSNFFPRLGRATSNQSRGGYHSDVINQGYAAGQSITINRAIGNNCSAQIGA